jgi:photosystem II stability/assembly factor-like uncharacterized protein
MARVKWRRASAWALFVASSVAPSVAFANGRFPAANQLVVDPDEPAHFLLRATYGLLASHDAGQSFSWICEDVLGDVGETDPAVALVHGGLVVTAAQDRLLVSDAAGCSFANALPASASEFPVDVSNDPADASLALAVARSGDGSGDVYLYEINGDSGEAQRLATTLGNDLFPLTLDAAKTEPRRIYVTALSTAPASVLLRSDDRGESWQRFEIHPYERLQAYIAAVDPNDADKLYVRVNDDPSDHLLVSTDAGEHFAEVTLLPTKLLGFALSPDGASIAVGGPGAPLQVASSAELEFAAKGDAFQHLSCLKWTEAGLYACADDRTDGFTLGVSSDAGASFAALFHAGALTPLACDAASDVGAECPHVWSNVEAQLATGAAGTGGGGAPAARPLAAPASRGGGCELGRGPVTSEFSAILLLAGLWVRRRRASRSPRN